MARAVTLDAGLKKALEARPAQPVEIGLVIARRTPARDLVLHLAATPPTEEGLPPARVRSAASGGRGGAGKGRGGGGGAPLDVEVDSEWVLEQTAQATRRLPGGLSVAGVYCSAPRLGQAGGPGAPVALHALAVSVGAEVYAALKSAYDPFAGSTVGWESGTESEAGAARRIGARGGVPPPPRRRRRRFGNAPPSMLPTSPPVFSPLVLLVDSSTGRVAARAAEGASSRGGAATLPTREVAVADLTKQLMAFETTLDVSVTVEGVDVSKGKGEGKREEERDEDASSDSDRADTDYDADTDDGRRGGGATEGVTKGAAKGRSPSSSASSLLAPSPEGMAAATARTLDGAIVLLGGQILEPGVPIESAVGVAIERVLAEADAEVEAQRVREERAEDEEVDEGEGGAAGSRPKRRSKKMGFAAPDARPSSSSSASQRRSVPRLSPVAALEALYGPQPHPTVSVDLATPAPPGSMRPPAAAAAAPSTVVAAGRASLRAVVGAKEDAVALVEALRNDAAVSALARGEALLETLADRARTAAQPAASPAFAMPARVAFPWPTPSLPLVADVISEGERPEDAWERVADVFGFDADEEGEGEAEERDDAADVQGSSRRGPKSALALETEAPIADERAQRVARGAASAPGGALARLSPAEMAKFGAVLLAVLVVVVAALVSKLS